MKFIQESAWQYLSVKLPAWGAFIFGVLPVLIQEGVNTQLIAPQYHAMLLTVVLPALALFGKKKYQPELHPEPTVLGFANLPVDSITFDEAFKRLIGHEGGYSTDRRDPGNWTGLLNHLGDGKRFNRCSTCSGGLLNHLGDGKRSLGCV